ncbi:response regulator [Massilia antarctica]|uniref:response regulator n=1 Tax=Massilia antarctica TaxID=2765360 RepID=UPI00227043A9|nr:response regulator [Massilia sp. H27-R4]MCY0912697.1 response regulator [Massilia sp. H27-R4]
MHTPGFEIGTVEHKLITEGNIEVRRQESLLKTGALQHAIFNSAYFSSIATDEKGVIQIFNVGAERMLGYTALDVVNRITPADISDPQEVIARAKALSLELETPITPGFEALVFKASRGIEDIYELTYVRKDGSRFPAIVSVTALRDVHEHIIGYLLIGTDNTARKQVEAAQALLDQRLRDQQFYTRSLIESNLDALMMTDPQGIISDVNQQMVALTGRTRDELIGAPSKKFFTDQTQADAAIKRVLQENKVTDYELTVRALNGVETVVSYNAATFHDRDRKLQGVFAAARDVTERKRFEHTLEVKNIELERASRMKSEFLATMSHELRTPLNAIIGFSEALKDGFLGQTSALQHECAGDIFSSGLHLLSLINDILDLSKVEAGMMALELDAADLHTLLPDSLTIVREKAAAQNIALSLEVGDDLGMPQLDIRKIKQIVYNLLSNAVKFSANGGAVTLHARRVARRAVGHLAGQWPVHSFPLADNEYNDFLELCVSDSGIGISEPDMATLFQAFSQIDSSLARKFEGTGLGLAMVRQLAELQGGTVAVASRAGEGSRFAVWLPLRALVPGARPALHGAAAAPAPAPEGIAAAPPLQPERIALVVEDNDQAAALARLLLEAEGFTVLLAASAEQALELAPRQALSLITLDIGLPGMDGWQLLQRLRENPALARVPVVVISAIAATSLALSGGAAAMLQKPVSHAQLHASLSGLGLQPSLKRTHTVLVAEHDPRAVEAIAGFLPSPAYAIVRAYTGSEAIFLARHLRPDLILLDLMLPDVSGVDVAEALQRDPATARIPILVGAAAQATEPRCAEKRGLDQARFVAEVRRALLPH